MCAVFLHMQKEGEWGCCTWQHDQACTKGAGRRITPPLARVWLRMAGSAAERIQGSCEPYLGGYLWWVRRLGWAEMR